MSVCAESLLPYGGRRILHCWELGILISGEKPILFISFPKAELRIPNSEKRVLFPREESEKYHIEPVPGELPWRASV
jgi:hypothetical protein